MKKLVSLFCLLTLVPVVRAQNNSGNNQNRNASRAQKCDDELKRDFDKRKEISAKTNPTDPEKKFIDPDRTLQHCEYLQIASWANRENLIDQDQKPTMDNKAVCELRAGFTLDFNDCKRVRDMYNAVLVAEQAMIKQQQIRQDIHNKQAQSKVAAASANGKLQEAAYNATIEKNNQLAALNREQAAIYSLAVGTLSTGILVWQKKNEKSFKKICSNEAKELEKHFTKGLNAKFTAEKCEEALKFAAGTQKSTTFANDTAKGFFIRASGEFVLKALEANRRAGLTDDAAKKMAAAMPQDQLVDDVLFEKCAMYPNMPECKPTGPKSPTSGFQGTSFTMDGNGSNAFDLNPVGGTETLTPEEIKKKEDEVLAPTSSPFESEAAAANEIIDAAAAASVTPGSASAPMGGGGGAGGGGGGGAAGGGNGGEEEEATGEAEIKSNKYTANYGGGSKGFESVKNAKEEANPFASLFDGKKEGGEAIEEDRSIASETESLGLFDKISKGYQKAYESKQIEANNLE